MSPAQHIGADGCKLGRWIACLLSAHAPPRLELFDSVTDLSAAFPTARLILLDVPIGLIDARRPCDTLAKGILAGASSRVFLAPARSTLSSPDYPSANALSKRLTGSGLSKQSFCILPRIREVDEFLSMAPAARASIREYHPEIAFWSLNHRRPVRASKKTPEGQAARLDLLTPHLPQARTLLDAALSRWPRRVVSADDIVDAMAGAVTAAAPHPRSLPDPPDHDALGLPMQMIYRDP
jgi:predicted RNase H-like nuclease